MGIYPLTFAHLFLGEPAELTAAAPRSPRPGVDLNLALAAGYADGAVAAIADHHDDRLVPAHGVDRDGPRPDRLPDAVPPPAVRHLDAVRRQHAARAGSGSTATSR